MRILFFIPFLLYSCKLKSNLEDKIVTSNKGSDYWRILKLGSVNYFNDTLLLKLYANKNYELFRLNIKTKRIVSLKPTSESDVTSYEFWETKSDSTLSFKKRFDFCLSNQSLDTMNFFMCKDTLIILPFILPPAFGAPTGAECAVNQ